MKTKRLLLWGLLGLGILLLCSPVLGLLGTAFFMARAFHSLEKTQGIADPGGLSTSIDAAPIAAGIGLLLAPVGIALIIASLIALRSLNRPIPTPLPPPFPPTQA